jgi:FAD/FMN-containing dehydrogenase
LRAIVGPSGWIENRADMVRFEKEERGLYVGRAAAVLRPADLTQVSEILAECNASGIAVVPQGGNTGLVGGGIPHATGTEIVLSLQRLNKIRSLDAANDTITVEAGCILADIQNAAASADRLFPLSLAAEGTCQIGGNLSTNAGGIGVLRYGMARDLVLGLEVVLADGRIWSSLKGLPLGCFRARNQRRGISCEP